MPVRTNTTKKTENTAPVVEVAPVAPVTPVVEATQTQVKGGAKRNVKKTGAVPEVSTPVVEVAPVVPAPVVEAQAPVKGGAKRNVKKATSAVPEVPTPVVEVAPATTPTPVRRARKAAATTPSQAPASPARTRTARKVAASKTEESASTVPVPGAVPEGEEESNDNTRSFKVQLPGQEDFCGRFTGLTPYQAANKALSKYFRSHENANLSEDQVVFSIRESTRGSNRKTYTYRGTRVKLTEPITYTITSDKGEARVITKQYKNQLVKVKKNNGKQDASAETA
jgi:hypothetical protein